MSDLFHPDVPLEFIRRVFDVMEGQLAHISDSDEAIGETCRARGETALARQCLDGREC